MSNHLQRNLKNKVVTALALVVIIVIILVANGLGFSSGFDQGNRIGYSNGFRNGSETFGSENAEECSEYNMLSTLLDSDSLQYFAIKRSHNNGSIDKVTTNCMQDLSEQVKSALRAYYGDDLILQDALAYEQDGKRYLMLGMQTDANSWETGSEDYEILSLDWDTKAITSIYKYNLKRDGVMNLLSFQEDANTLYFFNNAYYLYECATTEICNRMEQTLAENLAQDCEAGKVGLMKIDLESKQVTTLEKSAECV